MVGWRKGIMAGFLTLMPYIVSTGTGGSNDSLNKNSGLEEKVEFQDNFSGDEEKGYGDTVINGIELEEPEKKVVFDKGVGFNESGKNNYAYFNLENKEGNEIVAIGYADTNRDGEYDEIYVSSDLTRKKAGKIDLVDFSVKEWIGTSNPFDYRIQCMYYNLYTDKDPPIKEAKRKNIYEDNIESRFSPKGKDLQNFIFDDRIRAIRDAFEAYAEEGRVKPTYDILYKEFKTWQVNEDINGNLKSIETGVPESLKRQVIYPAYPD